MGVNVGLTNINSPSWPFSLLGCREMRDIIGNIAAEGEGVPRTKRRGWFSLVEIPDPWDRVFKLLADSVSLQSIKVMPSATQKALPNENSIPWELHHFTLKGFAKPFYPSYEFFQRRSIWLLNFKKRAERELRTKYGEFSLVYHCYFSRWPQCHLPRLSILPVKVSTADHSSEIQIVITWSIKVTLSFVPPLWGTASSFTEREKV